METQKFCWNCFQCSNAFHWIPNWKRFVNAFFSVKFNFNSSYLLKSVKTKLIVGDIVWELLYEVSYFVGRQLVADNLKGLSQLLYTQSSIAIQVNLQNQTKGCQVKYVQFINFRTITMKHDEQSILFLQLSNDSNFTSIEQILQIWRL